MIRLLIALLAVALAGQPALATPPPAALAEIDRHFRDWMLDARVPGMAWGIVADGRLVHVGTAGVQDLERRAPVTADTRFRIASMTKAFTALSVLMLRDAGTVALDAPAATYVPEMEGWPPFTPDSPPIRVRDLLHHTAGFVTDNPWGDRQTPLPEADFTAMLKVGVPMSRVPGTAFEYSNFGYAALGRIVQNAAGQDFARHVEATLLGPLGMRASGFDVFASPPGSRALGYRWEEGRWVREPDMAHGAFGAMGGLQTTANDYAKWMAFLLAGWPAGAADEPGALASRATRRAMAEGANFQSVAQRPGRTGAAACRQAVAYGMGLRVAQDCDLGLTLGHGGGYPGYGSFMLLVPETGVGIFAFANRTYAGPSAPVWDAAMALHRAGALKRPAVPVSQALASAYAAAGRMWRAGSVTAEAPYLAMNMLMDRSAALWAKELARLQGEVGPCATDAPIVAQTAMAGNFTWTCATGRIGGQMLLAPTPTPQIQALRLSVTTP